MICSICNAEIETMRNYTITEYGDKFHTTCLMNHIQKNGFSCLTKNWTSERGTNERIGKTGKPKYKAPHSRCTQFM
jgi:hypothetical protein